MSQYLVRRLILAVPVILGVSIAVFLMMHLIPGDPALAMLRGQPTVTEADIDRIRHQLGLDDPIPVQYLKYIGRALQGDFGESVHSHRPVLAMIGEQAWGTIQLALAAMLIAVTLGVILGTISALRQNSWVDTLSMLVALFGVSMPSFWFGLLLIYVFSLRLGWFPITGQGGLERLVLPAVALGMDFSAITARLVRSNLLEVLRQDYILSARAKGLRDRVVVSRHALRNAMIPGPDDRRPPARQSARGSGCDRDRLRPRGDRAPRHHGDPVEGLSLGPGNRPRLGDRLRRGEPCRRPDVRALRSADPLCLAIRVS